MKFLGDVNVFHGRIHNDTPVFTDELKDENGVRLLVRPHDLTVQLYPGLGISLPAQVYRVLTAGPLVKIELRNSQNSLVQVHVPHDVYRATPVKPEQRVYLVPKESRLYGNGNERIEYVI